MIKLYENSFITLEDANQYFSERFGSTSWESAQDDDKEKALITATKRINRLAFIGQKKSFTQPLEFPRKFSCGYYPPSLEMPAEIKDAVCEEAITLIEYVNNNGEESLNDPSFTMQSFKLGDVSVTNANTANSDNVSRVLQRDLMSENANFLVSKWTKKGFNIANPIYFEEN